MSDWFDSDDSETPKSGRKHEIRRTKPDEIRTRPYRPPRPPHLTDEERRPVEDRIHEYVPPPASHLIDQDRVDGIVQGGVDDWLEREAELNKRPGAFFDGDGRDDVVMRDEDQGEGTSEDGSNEADPGEDAQDSSDR